jgi:hypothetical protein
MVKAKSRQSFRKVAMPERLPLGLSFSTSAYDGTLFRAFEIEPHSFEVFVWVDWTDMPGHFVRWGAVSALTSSQAARMIQDRHHDSTCTPETIAA